MVFSRFVFTMFDVGIQEVTRGDRRLQGATGSTRGCSELQEVRGLQRITEDLLF